MTPKSERFEMRLDEETLGRIDKWRAKENDVPSRAEAIRRLIEGGLERAQDGNQNVRFTDGEKLIAMMMRDVYKHLKIRGEVDPEFVGDVMFGGHYWAPRWNMHGVFHEYEDDPRDVRFVVDVLDMWTFIEHAYGKLSAKEKRVVEKEAEPFGKNPRFIGFDGNNESAHLGISQFLIHKMNRFSKFKDRELNSHSPVIDAYRRMLNVFEPMRKRLDGIELSVDQLAAILKARSYA
jgi:uncharacterized protein YfbU (UPF0304 family)